jgi:ribonuclease J
MASNARIASERGYLDIPPGILVDLKDLESLPDEKTTVLSTGSQGEPMSAFFLMAFDRHKYLKVKPGDRVVLSSRFIPGNEKAINHIINEFFRRGADVLHEKIADVHVSGHASEEELRYMIRLIRPRCFIPVHGEYRHLLRHATVAIDEGIPPERVLVAQDGDFVQLSVDGPKVVRQFDVGRVFVHGKGVGDIGHDVLRDRRVMSEVGLVTVVVVLKEESGELVCGPEISSVGVTFEEIEPELMDGARIALEERLAELNPTTLRQWEDCREEIRLAVRRHIKRILGRKPLIQTLILTA